MIDLVESGLADAVEYADVQSRIEDISAAITIQRYGPVWTEHDTEPTRDGDEFDAVIAGAFLLRVYLDGVSDIEIERLADESGGDLLWATVAVSGNASLIDLDIAPSLVASGLTARVFYYSTDGVIKYMENTDVSVNAFTAPVVVGAVADVIYLAAVSLTKVYYITENSNNNRVLHVYELNGAWASTDSDIYWPYPIHAFDAVTFETGQDLLVLATDLPPLIGSRVVGAEVTQEVNQVQGVVTFWVANGRWSDHGIIDVIDKVETDLSRTSLRLSFYNNILFGAYLRCGGTEDYPYSKAAVIKSKDGVNWEFPELIDNFTPPFVILPRTDYLYAVGVDKVLRSPCCAWAGQTPVELDVTQYVVGLESSAAEIRNSQVRLSNPADVLASTLATEDARLQVVYDLGYVVGGSNLRVQVSTEDLISRGAQTVLPHQGVGLTTRDFLGRVNRVRSDYAAEWPGIQAGRDTYNDPSETGYGGLRHTAPYEGSWKTPGDEEIHLISKNKEGLAVSTFVTDALNGSAQTSFQLMTTGEGEYAGVIFRTFDKDNLHYLIYDLDADVIKLVKGVGTDDDADGERDNTVLDTSTYMSWVQDTWYWLRVIVRYSLVYAYYSTDGITWTAVNWVGAGAGPVELVGQPAVVGETNLAIASGRFGLIGYGYSDSDTWPPYDPPPWEPPVIPATSSWGMILLSKDAIARSWDFFTAEDPSWEDITGTITGTMRRIALGPSRQVVVTSSTGLWYCASIVETTPSWSCIKTDAAATAERGFAAEFESVGIDQDGIIYAPWQLHSNANPSGYYYGTAGVLNYQQYPGGTYITKAESSAWAVRASPTGGGAMIGCGTGGGAGAKLYHTATSTYTNSPEAQTMAAAHDTYMTALGGTLYAIADPATPLAATSPGRGLDGDPVLYITSVRYLYKGVGNLLADGQAVFSFGGRVGHASYVRNVKTEIAWVISSAAASGTIVVWSEDDFVNFHNKTGSYFADIGNWAGGVGSSENQGGAEAMAFPFAGDEAP